MLEKIAFIKSKTKLHKRSIMLSVWNMILSAIMIPFAICMAVWVWCDGELPAAFRYGQLVVYFLIIGRCWYTCYLRKWSHSYMLDYTQKILDPNTSFCPRCFSPIKVSQQDFTYEVKIGETETRVYYSNGDIDIIREPIMSKEKETLPHLACKERSCHLGSKTQKESAQSEQVRSQLKDNYSFSEMPRTLNKTYRLIAGDRKDNYHRSMADDMCLGGFWARILFLMGVLIVVSLFKDLSVVSGVFGYLWGTNGILVPYAAMVCLLLVAFIVFQTWVGSRAKAISTSKDFSEESDYYEELAYDIYLTKRLSDVKTKERKKAMKKARKEGLIESENYKHLSDGQWEKRKKAYRASLISAVQEVLQKAGYSIEAHYYNQCYILHAHSSSAAQPDCDFFITKDNCFMRGSTRFNFGAHQDYIESQISTVLQNANGDDLEFYVDKNLMCSRVSFGYLASRTLDIDEFSGSAVKESVSVYLQTMASIRRKVTPEVLRTIPPEYFVVREVRSNGFTLE